MFENNIFPFSTEVPKYEYFLGYTSKYTFRVRNRLEKHNCRNKKLSLGKITLDRIFGVVSHRNAWDYIVYLLPYYFCARILSCPT
jgi:hypothetical protein